jgi:plasmid maintenance system killer protein
VESKRDTENKILIAFALYERMKINLNNMGSIWANENYMLIMWELYETMKIIS